MKHEVPEEHRQTLELIHERLERDLSALATAQDTMQRRYAGALARLAATLGVEVPDGSRIEGDLESWALTITPPPVREEAR